MAINMNARFRIEDDGVTHINVWVKGKTELGRALSHFFESPFIHPFFGPFVSMEGFWHYIQSEERPDILRSLSGIAAKKKGKALTWAYVDNFHEIINGGNFYKIEQNPHLKEMFVNSTLPFDYYYLFTPKGDAAGLAPTIVRPSGYEWLVAGFEENRKMMCAGVRPGNGMYSQFIAKASA